MPELTEVERVFWDEMEVWRQRTETAESTLSELRTLLEHATWDDWPINEVWSLLGIGGYQK